MENKNIWDLNASASESVPEGSNKPKGDMSIVLYNLLALAFYTVICAIIGNGGAVIDAFLIGIHFFTCLIFNHDKWEMGMDIKRIFSFIDRIFNLCRDFMEINVKFR